MSADWDGLEGEAALAAELASVKQALARTSKQLFEIKHKHADYIEALDAAVRDAISQVVVVPVQPPSRTDVTVVGEEIAVALLSDLQLGKRTPDYDSDVCRARVMKYAQKIVQLADLQRRSRPVRKVVVPMLGDMVEGVGIFPGQAYLIDSTLYTQLFATVTLLADFLRYLAAHFDTVEVYAVDGNHGRLGRRGDFGPMDNVDRMVYHTVDMLLASEPRITVTMTDPEGERNWYHVMELGAYSALLIHGDQIRGSMGVPWYGIQKKVNSWAAGGLGRGVTFQDMYMGHYHQRALVPLNHRDVYANGSTESYNTFAQEMLAAQSEPSQWLLFVDPRKGRVTASYGVDLREE